MFGVVSDSEINQNGVSIRRKKRETEVVADLCDGSEVYYDFVEILT